MAQIIEGKKIAAAFCDDMRNRICDIKAHGIFPKIALINASSDHASEIYVSKKSKLAESIGILSDVYVLDENLSAKSIENLISDLNADPSVHAILLQSPLPKHLCFRDLVNLIHPDKDVDGLTTINQGRLFTGEPGIIPCTPLGVLHLIHTVHEKINGLHAVVLGRSSIVGKPLAQLLLNSNCTVTLLHSYSKFLPEVCSTADILISAIGKSNFVTEEFIKPGATVIDVGVNRIMQSNNKPKITGDVDFNAVTHIAGAITPVPNGVGPMTVAYLMHNTIKLACC